MSLKENKKKIIHLWFGIIVCIIVFHVHAKISEESLDSLQY